MGRAGWVHRRHRGGGTGCVGGDGGRESSNNSSGSVYGVTGAGWRQRAGQVCKSTELMMHATPAQYCPKFVEKGHSVRQCKSQKGEGDNDVVAVGTIGALEEHESIFKFDVELDTFATLCLDGSKF